MTYKLLDSGDGQKLEQLGTYRIVRPCAQAFWKKRLPYLWKKIDAKFSRENKNLWQTKTALSDEWSITIDEMQYLLKRTNFGHIGVFPEHQALFSFPFSIKGAKVLNLFAYTGAASMHLAKLGAEVWHVDASKKSVAWASKNAKLNGLEHHPIRWTVDDAISFLKRQVRRKNKFEGIVLDPPSFGRGSKEQLFLIEKDITHLLDLCAELMSEEAKFFLFSSHTPGFTPKTLAHLICEYPFVKKGQMQSGELIIPSEDSYDLPSGSYVKWLHA